MRVVGALREAGGAVGRGGRSLEGAGDGRMVGWWGLT